VYALNNFYILFIFNTHEIQIFFNVWRESVSIQKLIEPWNNFPNPDWGCVCVNYLFLLLFYYLDQLILVFFKIYLINPWFIVFFKKKYFHN